MSIVAWSSDLSTQSSFKSRYYLITAFSEHEECAYTFNDLMTAVSERIKMMVTPRLAQERGYPWLESGCSFMLSSLQGDLKWVNQHYGNLFDYRGNDFCGYCECKKRHDLPGMTLGDFTPSALHRSTIRTYRREDLVNRSFTWISYGCFCFDCLQFFFFVCVWLVIYWSNQTPWFEAQQSTWYQGHIPREFFMIWPMANTWGLAKHWMAPL